MESVEYRTLVTCTPNLNTLISGDPLTIANDLVAVNMISPGIINEISSRQVDDRTKACKLVKCVCDHVGFNPEKYDLFISVLKRHMWLDDLVKTLNDTHGKYCNS